jgi:coniferyl-aldehyde dehydrogenase
MFRTTSTAALTDVFALQRRAFAENSYPTLTERQERLRALRRACATVRQGIAVALAEDFGSHDPSIGLLWELGGVLARIRYTSEKLEEWMKPVPRECDPTFGDAKCYVRHQPKGVVGNMAPWNFPADISLGPLVDILAAGNRAVVKPSECAPRCAELVRTAIEQEFDASLVSVVTGEADLAQAFASVPWDHLIYTGNPAVARLVMAAAARNLTPVTLELGGKCPTIVAPDRVTEDTIADVLSIKAVKSGQVCLNTDYLLVPEGEVERVVGMIQAVWLRMFPTFVANPSATGIINARHYARLMGYVEDARAKGARVVPVGDERPDRERRKLPLTLVVAPPGDLTVMQEEIFGPILPIVPYRTIDDAIAYVNARERPLALYVFTDDRATADAVVSRTTSGGACVNSVAVHAAIPSLPFGGIGNSGMGYHHGYEGFLTFSHARSVFERGSINAWEPMRPPYGEMLAAIVPMIVDQE